MASRRFVSDVERSEAVRLAAEVGAKVAGERLGVPASTVRAWASKQRRSNGEPASAGVSERQSSLLGGGLDDIERLRRDVASIQRLMQRAVQHANRALQDGKSADAQRAAVTMGISADKLGQLSSVLSGLESQRVRLVGDQGQLVAAVIESFMEALGLRLEPAARRVLRSLLGQASDGAVLAASPSDAVAARAAVRDRIAAELRDSLAVSVEMERALPVSSEVVGEVLEGEPVEPVEPAATEPVPPESISDADVVSADEIPSHFLQAYRGDERLARSAWEVHKRRQAGWARREAEQGLAMYRPSTWRSIHDAPGGSL